MGNITLNKLFIYLCLFLSLSFFSDNNFSEQSQTQYIKGVVSSKLSINLNNPSEDSFENESFTGETIIGSFIQNVDYGAYLKIKFINTVTQETISYRDLLQYSSIQSGSIDLFSQLNISYFGEWFTNEILSLSLGYRTNDFKKIVEIRNY